jgi:fatty-acid desaturase
VPLYLWYFGVDWFQIALFAVLLAATGFSITLGYNRFLRIGLFGPSYRCACSRSSSAPQHLMWLGALGGFLVGGVAKVVVLQHGTFLINLACHTMGRQPYSTRCSARDSFFMVLL